jgi:hypothetical protein
MLIPTVARSDRIHSPPSLRRSGSSNTLSNRPPAGTALTSASAETAGRERLMRVPPSRTGAPWQSPARMHHRLERLRSADACRQAAPRRTCFASPMKRDRLHAAVRGAFDRSRGDAQPRVLTQSCWSEPISRECALAEQASRVLDRKGLASLTQPPHRSDCVGIRPTAGAAAALSHHRESVAPKRPDRPGRGT